MGNRRLNRSRKKAAKMTGDAAKTVIRILASEMTASDIDALTEAERKELRRMLAFWSRFMDDDKAAT